MATKTGDRIVVESETVGTPAREGEILEILQGNVGISYRVRWTDGHETLFTPGGGNTKIEATRKRAAASNSRTAQKRKGA
jgi:hypothetical protein